MARSSNGHLPQDLVSRILLRLPVRSIIRFKCVAKTWRSLFENPSFVSQHLSISKENNRLLVYHYKESIGDSVIRLFLDQTLVSYQDLLQQIPYDFNVIGTTISVYDGLLCLCYAIKYSISLWNPATREFSLCDAIKSRISLWNPATREFRLLPECNENIPPKVENYGNKIGFGSDPVSNDYKVTYIRNYVDLETDIPGPRHYAVYRMSTDSWRVLKREEVDFFEDLRILNNENNACVNGVYYWVANKFLQYSKILAFDFGKEVFQLIEWPPVADPVSSFGRLLPLPGDRISLWVSYPHMADRSNYIWVLNEERQHWTKLLRIEPLSGVQRMFGFWNKNGNKVLVESLNGQLMIYDLDTHEFKAIVGIKTGKARARLEVYTYEESLVATRSSNGKKGLGLIQL